MTIANLYKDPNQLTDMLTSYYTGFDGVVPVLADHLWHNRYRPLRYVLSDKDEFELKVITRMLDEVHKIEIQLTAYARLVERIKSGEPLELGKSIQEYATTQSTEIIKVLRDLNLIDNQSRAVRHVTALELQELLPTVETSIYTQLDKLLAYMFCATDKYNDDSNYQYVYTLSIDNGNSPTLVCTAIIPTTKPQVDPIDMDNITKIMKLNTKYNAVGQYHIDSTTYYTITWLELILASNMIEYQINFGNDDGWSKKYDVSACRYTEL